MKNPALLAQILAAIGAAGCIGKSAPFEATMCLSVESDAETCPRPAEVDPAELFHRSYCDYEAEEVLGEGELTASGWDSAGQDCCYLVSAVDTEPNGSCMVGRPYLDRGVVRLAPAALPADAPEAARAWAAVARLEHAAIAAFARLTLDLMAHGAPLALVEAAQRAAADEVRHARDAFALASRYAGQPVMPGAFPLGDAVETSPDLAALAAATVTEGCVGETLGAALAAEAAAMTTDPDVRALWERVALEEAEHAALAYAIVAWAQEVGGTPVRDAVAAAFATPPRVHALATRDDADTGRMGPESTRAAIDRAWREVITPARAALLAA